MRDVTFPALVQPSLFFSPPGPHDQSGSIRTQGRRPPSSRTGSVVSRNLPVNPWPLPNGIDVAVVPCPENVQIDTRPMAGCLDFLPRRESGPLPGLTRPGKIVSFV